MLYRPAILLPIVLSSSSELPNKPDRTARLLLLRLYYSSVPLLLLFHSITLFSYTIFSLIHSILSVSCVPLLLHTTCFATPVLFLCSLHFTSFSSLLPSSPLFFYCFPSFHFHSEATCHGKISFLFFPFAPSLIYLLPPYFLLRPSQFSPCFSNTSI